MKVKWSGIGVVDGRGKINGSVASKNRAGAYFRTKVTGVNPDTAAQQSVRATLASYSQGWRSLSQSQRDAWNAAVGDFSTTDIFGDLRNPTGKNLYVKLNANLTSVGLAGISNPPLPDAVPSALVDGVAIDLTAGTYEISFQPATVDYRIQLWATTALSPGVAFVGSRYRLINSLDGNEASPYDAAAEYVAKFGVPPAGQKVFFRMVMISVTSGVAGPASSASGIVVP